MLVYFRLEYASYHVFNFYFWSGFPSCMRGLRDLIPLLPHFLHERLLLLSGLLLGRACKDQMGLGNGETMNLAMDITFI